MLVDEFKLEVVVDCRVVLKSVFGMWKLCKGEVGVCEDSTDFFIAVSAEEDIAFEAELVALYGPHHVRRDLLEERFGRALHHLSIVYTNSKQILEFFTIP